MFKKLLVLLMALITSIAFAAVDVNSADATQLDSVKGIGPALSAKIVAARNSGKFKDWVDFVERVPGVGEKSAAKLSAAGLTVNGATFNGIPATPAAAKVEKAAKAVKTDPAPAAAPAPVAKAPPAPAPAPAAMTPPPEAPAKLSKAEKAAAAKQAKADKAAEKAQAKADAKAAKAEAKAAKASSAADAVAKKK